jgi:hypothetical protein
MAMTLKHGRSVEREASPHFRELVASQAVKVTFKGTLTTIWRKAG